MLVSTAAAGSTPAVFAAEEGGAEEGFVSLFDSESLDGWKPTDENPGSFLVEDGVLVVRGDRGHLFYDGPVGGANFKDFELRLKVMTTEGSNSGVYFHTAWQTEGWPSKGYEAQVNSTQSDPRKTGSLYGIADMYVQPEGDELFIIKFDGSDIFVARPSAPSVDGEWFDYTIIVEGKTITIKVDGATTVVWTEPDNWDVEGRRLDSGTIALQAHDPDSEVHYKDIRIKILEDNAE